MTEMRTDVSQWMRTNGNVVDGDRIMYVCGKYLMEQGRLAGNTIVTTVMSNLGLYKACDKIGMKYEQTAVGDKYVYENMLKNGFVLGRTRLYRQRSTRRRKSSEQRGASL